VRYGNVMGSRGSVIPYFMNLKREGVKEFPITDERMTRFWITLEESVQLVLTALENSVGGECFVPVIPSMKMTDLALAIESECTFKRIGIRPGEKIHETLVSEDEARSTKIFKNNYIILPQFHENESILKVYKDCPNVDDGFIYRSDTNNQWLTIDKLKQMAQLV